MKHSPALSAGRHAILVLGLALLSGLAAGHQDSLITLLADGQLEGLPAEYEPARLYIPATYGDGHVVLQLGANRLEFPDCLSVLFFEGSRPHMRLGASWYHDPKILPYYLSIDLPLREPEAHGFYDGWSILVDLKKATVLEVQAVFAAADGKSQREQEIDVRTFCSSGGVTSVLSP